MITEDYVSFETAKLLKEKGFNAELHMYWGFYPTRPSEGYIVRCPEDKEVDNTCSLGFSPDDFECIAPTLQMAMKWLREEYNLFIQVCIIPHTTITMEQKYYLFTVHKDRRTLAFKKDFPNEYYATYEECAEAAINYCLENLLQEI